MKIFASTAFLFLSVIGFGQERCSLLSNGVFDNDAPPGCTLCTGILAFSTTEKTGESFSFDFPCGEIENSQWFILKPDLNGIVKVLLSTSSCQNENGIEAAIYDENFELVSSCKSFTDLEEIVASDLDIDAPYYLMVDGVEGDICDVNLLTSNSLNAVLIEPEPIRADQVPPFCLGTEVCFSIPSVNFAIEYTWTYNSTYQKISGGGLQDTFLCLDLINEINGSVIVVPSSPCNPGAPAVFPVNVDDEILHIIDTTICEGACVQISDSCYFNEGFFNIDIINPPEQCDTMIFANIKFAEVFPSPLLKCEERSGQLFLEWNSPSGANEYDIFVNRDSITTVLDNFIFLDALPQGVPIDIKVQPKGSCTYLPGETTCIISTSNTTNDFLSNKISIYPNPTKGKLNIETDLKIEAIEVYDVGGRFLQKETTTSFDLKNRVSGIHFLKIKTNDGVVVKRVLVD